MKYKIYKMLLSDVLQKYWNFASIAHLNQFYTNHKGEKLPYINHIGSVVQELYIFLLQTENIYDIELAIGCAILHDTIEDTPFTHHDIENQFGKKIADGVLALTKNETIENKKERMADSLRRINQQPKEISLVKIADRIVNLQPPPKHWSLEKKEKYYEKSKLIHKELSSSNTLLSNRLLEKIKNYTIYLNEVNPEKFPGLY